MLRESLKIILGKTHQKKILLNTQTSYLALQPSYANHSPQKYDESRKSMCPGLPVTEMAHRENDKSSYHVLSTCYEWIFGSKVLCVQYL